MYAAEVHLAISARVLYTCQGGGGCLHSRAGHPYPTAEVRPQHGR